MLINQRYNNLEIINMFNSWSFRDITIWLIYLCHVVAYSKRFWKITQVLLRHKSTVQGFNKFLQNVLTYMLLLLKNYTHRGKLYASWPIYKDLLNSVQDIRSLNWRRTTNHKVFVAHFFILCFKIAVEACFDLNPSILRPHLW